MQLPRKANLLEPVAGLQHREGGRARTRKGQIVLLPVLPASDASLHVDVLAAVAEYPD